MDIRDISILHCSLEGASIAAKRPATKVRRWVNGIDVYGCKIWNTGTFIFNLPHIWLSNIRVVNSIICGFKTLNGISFGQYRSAFDCSDMIIKNGLFANNVIYGWPGWGLFYRRSMTEARADLKIINNTIVNNGYGIFIASTGENQAPEQFTGSIYNNIIAFNRGCGLRIFAPNQAKSNFNYNNVYENNPNYMDIEPGLNDIEMNPQFVDTSRYNYRLLAISHCIDKGIDLRKKFEIEYASLDTGSYKNNIDSFIECDVDGIKRMLDGDGDKQEVTDMGAFENYDNIFYNIKKKLWVGSRLLSEDVEEIIYNSDYFLKVDPGDKYNVLFVKIDGKEVPFSYSKISSLSSLNKSNNALNFMDTLNKVMSQNLDTIEKVRADHTIDIFFEIKKYKVVVAGGSEGKILPEGVITIEHGGNFTFNVICNEGYHISKAISSSGSSLISIRTNVNDQSDCRQSISIKDIVGNDSIFVSYAMNLYQVIISKKGCGSI